MQLHSISNYTQSSRKVWLYSAVYTGKISAYAVFILFVSFLIQPVHQALANGDLEVVEVVLSEPTDITEVDVIQDPEPTEVLISDVDTNTEENEDDITDNSLDLIENEDSELVTDEQEITVEEAETDDVLISDSNTSESNQSEEASIESDTDSSSASVSEGSENVVTEVSAEEESIESENDFNGENVAPGDSAETDSETNQGSNSNAPGIDEEIIAGGVNDIVKEVVNLTRQLVTEENYYQFSRQSCVSVGDGTFHCSVRSDSDVDPQSVVYADRDDNGRMQIFMRTSRGNVEQITDNEYDNTSPDFDAESMRIVWQQLIDGRYQIMIYNLNDKKTTQLTFSRNNSMEPKVSGDGVVWQGWDGNDWEIFYFDGKITEQITDNQLQDVTPVIEDGYILWSILGGDNQEARVYNLKTKQIMTITGHEGGAIANPRFVLVYDTKFDNGDIITQGFDPVTGLSAPIAAKPATEPIEIPDSDPIGEIRALIQNKSTSKEQNVVSGQTDGNSSTEPGTSTTGSTTADTLVLKTAQVDIEEDTYAETPESHIPEFELTEYDLVITDEATSSTSSRPSVYDIDMTGISTGTASSTQ